MLNKKTSILIVEDHDSSYSLLYEKFSKALKGAEIYQARTHDELREKLETGKYDIAICDFDLTSGQKADAARTARILDELQPNCIRIGLTILDIEEKDYYIKDLFQFCLSKLCLSPELIKEKLKPYGF